MIANSILDLIGKTPVLFAKKYGENLGAKIFAKLEYLNPSGSAKDRAAKKMIENAESLGILKSGGTIIEPTSGNMGISLAMAAAVKGYNAIFTMPDTMSEERQKLLKSYGAKIVLTDGKKSMDGAIEKAKELQKSIEGAVILGQFENPANTLSHEESTGPELWQDFGEKIDFFVAGVGTGGTICGTARFLKRKNPNIKIFAVEPASSPVISCGKSGAHKIQGIGAGFLPPLFDRTLCDEIICVSDDDAILESKKFAKTEGALVGISSGAALFAAKIIAARPENAQKTIVALLPDSGDRYLSVE